MFSQSEREIFDYEGWDGTKFYADPAKVLRRFKEYTKGAFNVLVKQAADPDPAVASPAIEQLGAAVFYAFEFQSKFNPSTGEGWLEVHLLALGDRFNRYVNGLKKNTAPPAT